MSSQQSTIAPSTPTTPVTPRISSLPLGTPHSPALKRKGGSNYDGEDGVTHKRQKREGERAMCG
jgi:hypothetical protein